MEFNPKSKEDLEELLFCFMMEMESKKDFEKYFQLPDPKKETCNTLVRKIYNFFQKNYIKQIRNKALDILEENYIKKLKKKSKNY